MNLKTVNRLTVGRIRKNVVNLLTRKLNTLKNRIFVSLAKLKLFRNLDLVENVIVIELIELD